MRLLSSTALLAAPIWARAQEVAGPTSAPAETKLWWVWIALAFVLLGAMIAILASREPRARAH
jgi:hypothetical protein